MREIDAPKANQKTEGAELDLARLIAEQGVKPVTDLDELADLWPADDDPDALMSYVLSERQARGRLDAEDHQPK